LTVVAQYRRHIENTSRKGALMLRATHRVMETQLPILNGNRRLVAAWRQGERYWRDHFSGATIREVYAHLVRWEPWRAVVAFAALLWYVRGRLFLLPWKHRRRVAKAVRQVFGIPPKHADRCPSSIAGR
jgi:hypothetical protein